MGGTRLFPIQLNMRPTPDELRHLPADQTTSLPPVLRALWHDAQGNWTASHEAAQDVDTPDGAWVHAYLHRKEGDPGNAAYWYRRAGKPIAAGPFETEWQAIASSLLARETGRPA